MTSGGKLITDQRSRRRPARPGGALFDHQTVPERRRTAPARLVRAERCLSTRERSEAAYRPRPARPGGALFEHQTVGSPSPVFAPARAERCLTTRILSPSPQHRDTMSSDPSSIPDGGRL